MSTFTWHEVTDSMASSGPDFEALSAYVDLSRFEAIDTTGHDDFTQPLDVWAKSLKEQDYQIKRLFLIKNGNDYVGSASLRMPTKDNLSLAYNEVIAYGNDPEVLAYGHALLEEVVRDAGRTTMNSWLLQKPDIDAEGPNYLAAPTGVGGIDASYATAKAMLDAGWQLEQVERYSVLELPVAPELASELSAKAAIKAAETYELVQWMDHTPEQYVAGHCILQQAMSTDVPHGELEIEETVYDAQRLNTYERIIQDLGKRYLLVAAVHKATGELAGFSRVEWALDNPAAVFQEETLVRKDHRGFALGLWIKAHLVEEILRVNPSAKRIHTWNAGENEHMLAINVALGFEKRGVEGAWQKKLS